jgi:hypothetical protein
LKQLTLQDVRYLLPNKRSRDTIEPKAIFQKKELTERQKEWLKSHDETNWQNIILTQNYTNPKGISKKLVWKLPGTEPKGETCGQWKTVGCDNVWGHPENKQFVKHSKISCFKSSCEYCWLEKWLSRESARATTRIEKYVKVWENLNNQKGIFQQRKHLKPIHVIVSPSWKDKFLPFDELKNKTRKLMNQAGIEGGLMIYHPFGFDKKKKEWVVRPHFHILGFGWVVNTKKISEDDGWVIKNKGIRNSLHSTIYYQLSHAGVTKGVHAITWFGTLSYRAKYSPAYKIDDDEEHGFCDYCHCMLVDFEYVGLDKPPDFEFVGLVDYGSWKAKETLEQAVDRKRMIGLKFKKESNQDGLSHKLFTKN